LGHPRPPPALDLHLPAGSAIPPRSFRPATVNVPEFWFNRIHPEDRQRVLDTSARCEIEKTEYRAEYRIVLPDGTVGTPTIPREDERRDRRCRRCLVGHHAVRQGRRSHLRLQLLRRAHRREGTAGASRRRCHGRTRFQVCRRRDRQGRQSRAHGQWSEGGVDTFGVGEDSGQPVTPDYEPPFKFTGTIDKVVIELGPMDLSEAYQATVRKAEHRAYQMTE
jgi:PAS fold